MDPTAVTQVPATQQPTNPPAEPPGPVPYERFKEVNEGYKTLQARLAQLEESQRTAAEAKLAEEKRWQELAQQRDAELKRERAERMRSSVALSKGLTPDLAARLQGDDEAALAADADKLLVQVQAAAKRAEGPGVPPAPQGGRPVQVDLANMSPEQVREYYRKGQVK